MKKHSNYLLQKRILFNRWGRKGNIIMFHAARCGSTVIGDLLDKKVSVDTDYKKTNPFPLDQVLENFDEVAALLKGTNYEWMLSD